MTTRIFRNSLRTSCIMLAFALVGTGLLAFTFDQTRGEIAASEAEEKLKLITQVIPRDRFDNDLIDDVTTVEPSAQLGTSEPTFVYRARFRGEPTAAVLEAIAPDGYSGKIKLLLAVLADGRLAGVRVLAHNETPGLGDYIDIAKSRWITQFDGLSLERNKASEWRVKKDGGRIDSMAGATITPRAVVKAVYKALQYFADHKAVLFAAPVDGPPGAARVGKAG